MAYAFQNFTELPPSSNRGQVVDRFVKHVGLDPKGAYAWCAAYVYYCGWYGLYDPVSDKSVWPLPKTAGCYALGRFAEQRGVLKPSAEAQAGDVFLVWYVFRDKAGNVTEQRFGHTGFLVHKNADGSWMTLEANTSKPGDTNPATAREGWGVFQRTRVLKERDRVIRWSQLL